MNLVDKKLLKFLIVGVVNTCFGAGIMFLLYNVFDVSYWVSSACNYILGGILSFFLNKFFTFNNKQKSFRQVLYFVITLVICYLISYVVAKKIIYLIFLQCNEKLKGNIALICGMCLYTLLNYIGQRFIVFSDKEVKMEKTK